MKTSFNFGLSSVSSLLTVLVSVGVVTLGCSGAQRGGSSGSATTYTFENRSSATLCEVWLQGTSYESYGRAMHRDTLATGASVQLTLRGPVQQVFATECGSARTIVGSVDSNDNPRQQPLQITAPRIVLFDAGEAPASTPQQYALSANPQTPQEWADAAVRMLYNADSTPSVSHDEELANAALQRVRNFARQQHWSEEFFVSIVTTDGWINTRDWRATWMGPRLNVVGRFYDTLLGARWNDGHCTLQHYRLTQRGDGENWEDRTNVAVGPQIPMPCAMVEGIASSWEGAGR